MPVLFESAPAAAKNVRAANFSPMLLLQLNVTVHGTLPAVVVTR